MSYEKVCPECGDRFAARTDDDGEIVTPAEAYLTDHLTDAHDAFTRVLEHGAADPGPDDRGRLTITLPDGVAADVPVERFRQTGTEGDR